MLLWTPGPGFKVTPTLVGINVLVFIALCVVNLSIFDFSGRSLLLFGANFRPLIEDGQWWRFITSMFIHLNLSHLLFNCMSLLFLGRLIEPLLGHFNFFLAYMVTGIIASFASFALNVTVISAGASGAIFGLLGIFVAILLSDLMPAPQRKEWLKSVAAILVLNLGMGLILPVDNYAHIGGLISGIVIGFILVPMVKLNRRNKR